MENEMVMRNNTIDDDSVIRLDNINVRIVIRDICKNFWIILLMAVSAWMLVSAYAKTLYVPQYTSTITFAVTAKDTVGTYNTLTTNANMAGVFGEIFQSDVLKDKVAAAMGTDELDGTISTEVITETNLLKVSAVSSSPQDAYQMAQAILENYSSISDNLFDNAVLEIIQNPQIPMEASDSFSVNLYRNLAALAAAVLAAGMIMLLTILRDTVQTKQAAKNKLEGKMLGCIGHEVKNKAKKSADGKKKKTAALISNLIVSYHFMEAYRSLCSRLEFRMRRRGQKVVLVTSAGENEGKSTVAANLALSLAAGRKKVLLLDCDFRKPAAHKIFEINMDKVTDFGKYLLDDRIAEPDIIHLEKQGIDITVNHVGYPSPQKMITSERMKQFLDKAKGIADYIVIDSPPMLVASDTEALARLADTSVLVVRQDRTPAGGINDCIDVLNQSAPDFAGYVLNDFYES